jgi:hypothetical protein
LRTSELGKALGMDEQAIEATGKLSEALEYIERARGHLFDLHQLIGHADLLLDEVLDSLEAQDRPDLQKLIRSQLYGRNVLGGKWTFELVEEFDDGFYAAWKDVEFEVRDELTDGKRHVLETRMKKDRQARGVNASAPSAS